MEGRWTALEILMDSEGVGVGGPEVMGTSGTDELLVLG